MIIEDFLKEHKNTKYCNEYVPFNIQQVYNQNKEIVDGEKKYSEQYQFGLRLPYKKCVFFFENKKDSVSECIFCTEENPLGDIESAEQEINLMHADNITDEIRNQDKESINKIYIQWAAASGRLCFINENGGNVKWIFSKDTCMSIPINDKYGFSGGLDHCYCLNASISKDSLESYAKFFDCVKGVLFTSLLLLNCKNFRPEKIKFHPENPVNKKRIRNGHLPLLDKYILNVPINLKPSKNETLSQYHNRLHACRGHFKQYSDSKPLFGKYKGAYWWNNQIRGNKKLGIIKKSYKAIL